MRSWCLMGSRVSVWDDDKVLGVMVAQRRNVLEATGLCTGNGGQSQF